jgi:O-antigen/teichoic acid export membrane protein
VADSPGTERSGVPGDPDSGSDAVEEAGARAAKNTAVRAAGEIFGKVGSLVLFAVLARETGPAGVGVYVLALAWGEVSMTPVGLGIDRYMMRRLAEDRSRLEGLLWNAFYLKLARGIPVVLLSTVLAFVLPLSSEETAAVALITLGMLFDTLARTLLYTFNAFERGELAAAIVTTDKLLAAALGLAVLAAGYGVVAVAITFAIGTAAKLLLGFVLLFRRVRRPAWDLPREPRRDLRKRSLPFTVEDVFGLILARIDVLLLSALAASAIVGLYGSAYRLIDSTTFLVVALSGAFTAMYTYLGPDTTPTLQSVYQRSIKLTVALLLPIAVSFAVLAEPLCRLFFGAELADAGDSLRILAPVVVLFGVIVMSTNLVVSRSNPMRVVKVVAAVAVVNLGLNVALIPSMEDEGAALAMLASEVLYVGLALRLAVPLAGGVRWLPTLAAPVAAGAAMAAAMLPLDDLLGLALLAGTAAYALVFTAIDSRIDPRDLQFVKGLVAGRLRGRRDVAAGSGSA